MRGLSLSHRIGGHRMECKCTIRTRHVLGSAGARFFIAKEATLWGAAESRCEGVSACTDLVVCAGVSALMVHAAGDEALEAFGGILRRQTRDSDIAGRYGGEEFLAILPSSDVEGARQYAERVRESLSRHELPSGTRITVSAGVAVSGPTMSDASELVRAADAALYQAKAAGGNRVDPGPARSESPATTELG